MSRTRFNRSLSSPKIDVAIDMGNLFLNRTINRFLKIGTMGASKVTIEENYHILDKGHISKDSTQKALKKIFFEGAYWGAVAGVYVGIEYGMERIRGTHDWKNIMLGGALIGVIMSVTIGEGNNIDKVVMDAITRGIIATAAEFLNYLV